MSPRDRPVAGVPCDAHASDRDGSRSSMIEERELREALHRRADAVGSMPIGPTVAVRRARRRLAATASVSLLTIAALVAGVVIAAGHLTVAHRPVPASEPAGIDVRDLVWSKVTANDATFGSSSMSGVVAVGQGFVAVGGLSNGISAPSSFGAGYVWVSADGSSWRRLRETFGSGLVDVTAGGPGLVAVGGDESGPMVL